MSVNLGAWGNGTVVQFKKFIFCQTQNETHNKVFMDEMSLSALNYFRKQKQESGEDERNKNDTC